MPAMRRAEAGAARAMVASRHEVNGQAEYGAGVYGDIGIDPQQLAAVTA